MFHFSTQLTIALQSPSVGVSIEAKGFESFDCGTKNFGLGWGAE